MHSFIHEYIHIYISVRVIAAISGSLPPPLPVGACWSYYYHCYLRIYLIPNLLLVHINPPPRALHLPITISSTMGLRNIHLHLAILCSSYLSQSWRGDFHFRICIGVEKVWSRRSATLCCLVRDSIVPFQQQRRVTATWLEGRKKALHPPPCDRTSTIYLPRISNQVEFGDSFYRRESESLSAASISSTVAEEHAMKAKRAGRNSEGVWIVLCASNIITTLKAVRVIVAHTAMVVSRLPHSVWKRIYLSRIYVCMYIYRCEIGIDSLLQQIFFLNLYMRTPCMLYFSSFILLWKLFVCSSHLLL